MNKTALNARVSFWSISEGLNLFNSCLSIVLGCEKLDLKIIITDGKGSFCVKT